MLLGTTYGLLSLQLTTKLIKSIKILKKGVDQLFFSFSFFGGGGWGGGGGVGGWVGGVACHMIYFSVAME